MKTVFFIYNGSLSGLLTAGSLSDGTRAGLLSPALSGLLQTRLSESSLEKISPDSDLPLAGDARGYLCRITQPCDPGRMLAHLEGYAFAVIAEDAYLFCDGNAGGQNIREDLAGIDLHKDAERFLEIVGWSSAGKDAVPTTDRVPESVDEKVSEAVSVEEASDSATEKPSDTSVLPDRSVPSNQSGESVLPDFPESPAIPAAMIGADSGKQLTDETEALFNEIESAGPAESAAKKGLVSSIFDWFEVFCIALISVLLLVSFVARQSPVEGSSMYPTLVGHAAGGTDPEHGLDKGYDVLLISNLFYTPKRSDIVVIQEPSQLSEPIVKRIIALEGDTVRINFNTWEVSVNGKVLDEEEYVNFKNYSLSSQGLTVDSNNCWEGTVPEGCIFVLGDNRLVSKDSRTFGFIDQRYIIGKVIFRIAPFSRIGTVED